MPKDKTRAFYICDELDCGFRYTHKVGRGPSKNRPILEMSVYVVDLGKKVKIRFVGFGDAGMQKLTEHGHDGYIFPVNLFVKPYTINPAASKAVVRDLHERWLRLIAAYKGVPHISFRKEYVLVADDGTILRREMCSPEEFAETLEFQKRWAKRNPDETPASWHLAEEYEEKDVSIVHSCQSQQAALVP